MDEKFEEYFKPTPEKWLEIGCDLYNKGQLNESIKAYQEGLKLDPNYGHILFNLACNYEEIGKFDTALELLNRYLEQYDDKFGSYKKAILLSRLNRNFDAIPVFKDAEKIQETEETEYCINERKKAIELLNLQIITENQESNDENKDEFFEKNDEIQFVSPEKLKNELYTYIKEKYPDYEYYSLSSLFQGFWMKKGVNKLELPIEFRNQLNKIEIEVKNKLIWDLVPKELISATDEEIATELVTFIKDNLMIKGRIWVPNYSNLFRESKNIGRYSYPPEIKIKLIRAESIAQDILDAERAKRKKE